MIRPSESRLMVAIEGRFGDTARVLFYDCPDTPGARVVEIYIELPYEVGLAWLDSVLTLAPLDPDTVLKCRFVRADE